MAANGLVPMLDPRTNLFCYRLNRTPEGLVREGISPRYTVMCLLGLHRFETAGGSSPLDLKRVFDAVLSDLAWVDNIGDLGLMIWTCAMIRPEKLEELYLKLAVSRALEGPTQESRTMEVAWFLSGLAHAAIAGGNRLPGLQGLATKTHLMLIANQGKHGLFGHAGKGSIRGRIGSFADQVYPTYALAKFSEAFGSQPALTSALRCGEAICRLQGSRGQWWWHYDAVSGKVFQRYPVYSVHQHGMAPLALFALGDAARLDFRTFIDKGLAWIEGHNELGLDMRDPSANLVWRSIYRTSRVKMYAVEFLDFLRGAASPVRPSDLGVVYECRPYELGWLLYGFAGRESR